MLTELHPWSKRHRSGAIGGGGHGSVIWGMNRGVRHSVKLRVEIGIWSMVVEGMGKGRGGGSILWVAEKVRGKPRERKRGPTMAFPSAQCESVLKVAARCERDR